MNTVKVSSCSIAIISEDLPYISWLGLSETELEGDTEGLIELDGDRLALGDVLALTLADGD